ncbi:MAG: hypothetical protein ACREIW_14520, partial [Chthoniobacterales bacterium]
DQNLIPNIATRYIRTTVSAPNGSTIILGGLIQEHKEKSKQGLPYLSQIPYVGALFRSTTTNKMRTELVILMCPQVSLTKLDRDRLRQKWESENAHLGPELDQGGCADCPETSSEKQVSLPPPDIPAPKD